LAKAARGPVTPRSATGWRRFRQPSAPGSSAALVKAVLAAHEVRNFKRLTAARTLVFVAIFVWLWVNYGWWVAAENGPILAAFIANGLIAYALSAGRDDRRWVPYAVVLVDAILLAFTLVAPGRTYPDEWPWPTVLRQPSFLYFLLLPAIAALSFRPIMVLWSALCVVGVWLVATALVMRAPGAVTELPEAGGPGASDVQLVAYLDPNYVHVDDVVVRVFLTALIGMILAYGAYRARALMIEQAEVVRERANLARYVAPTMVDALARIDRPMGEVRTHEAAVLFVDIKGFTALAEAGSPAAAMRLLRAFHGRMAAAVFTHGGTLDKFIGDGLMATFGTPEPQADAADRAFACGVSMLAAIEAWQADRVAQGQAPLGVGIGVHFGPVTMGDIGGGGDAADGIGQRFEFAVIGDTVNVASRLERLTRELDVPLLVSDAVVQGLSHRPAGLRSLGEHSLDGRSGGITVWTVD
jgi:adenylate cyclase